ncbi:MAG: hypothetical protein H7A40_02860 [Chlamydiales bacterium]|nr:hypothetical protein [Chlamydiales bacterium]
MKVQDIANTSLKVLLWAGASTASFYVVANIARAVLRKGRAYCGISQERLPKDYCKEASLIVSLIVVPILVALPLKKVVVGVALLAWGVFWGLTDLHRIKRLTEIEQNKILNFFSDAGSSTPNEALKFYRENNQLIKNGQIEEAIKACEQYTKSYRESHPEISVWFVLPTADRNSDTVVRLDNVDEAAIRDGILHSLETRNYSLLICFSQITTVPFMIGVIRMLENKDIHQYKLFSKIFGSQNVDYFCLWLLILCRPVSEELRLFWLSSIRHVKFPSPAQLRMREKGGVPRLSGALHVDQLNSLLIRAVMSQNQEYLKFLITQGANVNFTDSLNGQTPVWKLIKREFHREINTDFLDLLVRFGANLHHKCKGLSILDFVFMESLYMDYSENSNEWKIIRYLIDSGVKYNANSVPRHLQSWVSNQR